MTSVDQSDRSDEVSLGDFFRPLLKYRRFIWQISLVTTAVVATASGAYYLLQPTRWVTSIGFRPLFAGVELGEYPNKLPFGPSDVIDPTIVDQVFDKNHLQEYCTRDEFRAGMTIDESSPELQLLELDYLGRLSDVRLSAVDRSRLQEEYLSRRLTMPRQYRLMFIKASGCSKLPASLVTQALNDVLQTWASDAERKRGVLNMQVALLTPDIFEFSESAGDQSLLVRADLVRAQLARLIDNVEAVQKLPGADLVHLGSKRTSFAAVRAQLEDLQRAQLEPLVAMAGRNLGTESIRWAEQSLQAAVAQREAANQRAQAYRDALREYSGNPIAPAAGAGTAPRSQSDVQTLTPQIDRTFIDKIVELSEANTKFRQEITRELVDASVETVNSSAAERYFTQLVSSLKSDSRASLSATEVTSRLTGIIAESKRLAVAFNELFEEFSRVSLRPGPEMYRVESPASSFSIRAFSLRTVAMIVLGTLLAAPVIVSILCLFRFRFRQLLDPPRKAT